MAERSAEPVFFAGVELGGTSIVASIVQDTPMNVSNNDLFSTFSVPTLKDTAPEESLKPVVEWLEAQRVDKPFKSLGIATFGPVDLGDPASDTFGMITSCPSTKKSWEGFKVLKFFKEKFSCAMDIDTDVNATAMGQFQFGMHDSVSSSLCYITVGTGIGVGVVTHGQATHRLHHPEGGHMIPPKHPQDKIEGLCNYHKNCIEGLSATHSIALRSGVREQDLPNLKDEDVVWEIEAHYLAHLCVNITLLVAPECIVLGGGVLNRSILYDLIRKKHSEILNGYVKIPKVMDTGGRYISAPLLGGKAISPSLSGPVGSLTVAFNAFHRSS